MTEKMSEMKERSFDLFMSKESARVLNGEMNLAFDKFQEAIDNAKAQLVAELKAGLEKATEVYEQDKSQYAGHLDSEPRHMVNYHFEKAVKSLRADKHEMSMLVCL
jgi:hypothetical protein